MSNWTRDEHTLRQGRGKQIRESVRRCGEHSFFTLALLVQRTGAL